MKGLFSGRQIKDLKGRSQKITRSQTASSAYAAIIEKYGSIQDNAHYYHLGKGNWHKYSLENDRKRTGKLAESKAQWAERPNKFDWVGIDTKAEGAKKPKRSFSVSSLKASAPVGRHGKAAPKFAGKPVTKAIKLHDENAVMAEIRRLQRENADLQAKINAVDDFDKRHDGRHKPFVAKQESNNKEIKRLKNRYDFLTEQGEYAPRKPKVKATKKTKPENTVKAPKFTLSSIKAASKLSSRTKKVAPRGSQKGTKTMPYIPTDELAKKTTPMLFADKDADDRFNFYAKFTNGNFGNLAKSENEFMRGARNRGFKEENLFELKVAEKQEYGQPIKWIVLRKKSMPKPAKTQQGVLNREEADKKWEKLEKGILKRTPSIKADMSEVLKRYIKNAKIETSEKTVKIYSPNPENAYSAVLRAIEKGYNAQGQPLVRQIRNKILFNGYTISVHKQVDTSFIPYTGEYRGYKYKVSTTPGKIEYFINGVHKVAFDEKFNINTCSKKYVDGRAKITINDLTNTTPKEIRKLKARSGFMYASFMRPLGSWFNPGTPFKIETVTSSDRDFRYNRSPHSVISTGSRLSEETLKKFELVDLAEGRKMQELIKYVNSHSFLNDSMKGQLESLVLKGKGKTEIDKYIEKGRKMSEKKNNKPKSTKQERIKALEDVLIASQIKVDKYREEHQAAVHNLDSSEVSRVIPLLNFSIRKVTEAKKELHEITGLIY